MSVPAAPEGFLSRLSFWLLAFLFWLFFVILGLAVVASIVASLDWKQVGPALAELALVIYIAFLASQWLPGPVKRVGKAAGRGVVRAVKDAKGSGASWR